jgi:hypothetical protein
MSGQEEHSDRQQVHLHVDESHQDDNAERFVDLMMMASAVQPPPMGSNLLDYLYAYGVPISPFQPAGSAGANNWNNIESAVASILSRSLYDRHPVKKVISEEARCEIVHKKFTAAMVKELKINDMCGIWQEEFEEDEDIKILPCNHAFKADAIMKWLEEEKAECPVCRFSLKSKEVNENQDQDQDQDSDDDEFEDEMVPAPPAAEAAAPAQDDNNIRVNNIASRLVQSVAGRVSQPYHYHYGSVPMNQLLQNVRTMSSSLRQRGEPIRAAVPSASGAAAVSASASYAHAGREVRAEAIQHAANPNPAANNNNNNNNNNNYYNIINNYYYDNNHNHHNHNNDNNDVSDDDNNNYSDDEDVVLNQEEADIEEAIRRSLEQN